MQNSYENASGVNGRAVFGATEAPPSALDVLYVHERRRRTALLRVISLGVLVPVALLIPTALIPTLDKVTLIALILALVGTLGAFLLNQAEQIGAGSFMLLAGLSAAVAWEIVAKAQAQHGIDLSDLRLYDLFILPIVVSAVLVGRRGPVIFGGGAALFTIFSLILLPHTPELQTYWDGHYKDALLGSVYDVVAVPIAIQVLASTAAWLGAESVRRALLEASRADELSAANAQVQEQSRQLEQQRYRLQQGIAQLQAVHTAVARGQWDARASTADGELLPVALSLNLLLDRISRMTRDAEQRNRIDIASHELAVALRRLRAGEAYTPPNYTGTPFDEVLVELARLRSIPPPNSGRTTGYDLGGPSAPPRSLPSPASQPERPFPFGPPSTRVAPQPYAPPPAAAMPPARPPSSPMPGLPFSADGGFVLQPGRMSLPPMPGQMQQLEQMEQRRQGQMQIPTPAPAQPLPFQLDPYQSAPVQSVPTQSAPTLPMPPAEPMTFPMPAAPQAAPSSGRLSLPPEMPTTPQAVPPIPPTFDLPFAMNGGNGGNGSNDTAQPDLAPDSIIEQWPDLTSEPTPERGPNSTALPAWLQAQATAATPAASSSFSASDLVQTGDLPPWLREVESTGASDALNTSDEDDSNASNFLPPWLQNMQ